MLNVFNLGEGDGNLVGEGDGNLVNENIQGLQQQLEEMLNENGQDYQIELDRFIDDI